MSQRPAISVVMSVYNDAEQLKTSVESVLNQSFSDFEFIIINDGSTDHSADVLAALAEQDHRIKILTQANQGLTRALIKGCDIAQGKYIARQDVGDYSLPRRFEKQLKFITQNKNCMAVFTGYDCVDSFNERLFGHCPSNELIAANLNPMNNQIACPSHHGCALFEKQAYQQAGGYRKEFYFAQDLDLWMRLNEFGEIKIIDECLYKAQFNPLSISGSQHQRQKIIHDQIAANAIRRAQGQAEDLSLSKNIKPQTSKLKKSLDRSKSWYFMGSCIADRRPDLAKLYFKNALKANPVNFKAWYKLLAQA